MNFFYVVYTNPVRTSQESHYVSTTKPNRLMLFRESVAVYCEDRTEHTDTLLNTYLTGNTLRFHYRAQPVNVFGETVPVCEDHTEHTDTLLNSYLTGNTLRLRCRDQPVNAV
jgi:hypothetical protein